MSTEAQREIEKDLLAYKQRRREQAGAPLELHPATRKMLQSEAARTTARPLLTSEEAAKNFVRSFVMSHQQPGFFARHRQRVIWGGAMFACLAIVLAVLRNDPQQSAQRRAFPDALPALPATPAPQPAKPQGTIVANQTQVELERLSRDRKAAPVADGVQELAKVSAAPVGSPAPANPRGASVASDPMSTAQREMQRSSGGAGAPSPALSTQPNTDRYAYAPAPTGDRPNVKAESTLNRTPAMDADRKLAEKPVAGEPVQLTKMLKDSGDNSVRLEPAQKKATEESKVRLDDELKRTSLATAAGLGGALAPGTPPPAAPKPASAPVQKQQALGFADIASGLPVRFVQPDPAAITKENAPASQRFQQLDNRAGYRQNFNSPPMPQVMQDFAFERTGDRVRIVDADGSTYVGTVLPAVEEELRDKLAAASDGEKARKDASTQPAQSANAQSSYRFIASGVNRKLNQSVEFRGEWQPAAPTQSQTDIPALQQASFGVARPEAQAAEKKLKAPLTNALADNAAPAKAPLDQLRLKELSQGRISGRAVVGGKNEFDISAVPK